MRSGAVAGLMLAVMLDLAGCIIPADLHVIEPDVRFKAECVCTLCTQQNGVVCDQTQELKPVQLFECADRNSNALSLKTEMVRRCDKVKVALSAAVECHLTRQGQFSGPAFPPGAEYLSVAETDVCDSEDGKFVSVGSISNAIVTLDSPTVARFSASRLAGEASLRGRLAFSGGNCTSGQCPILFHWLSLSGDDFTLSRPTGETVRRPGVINAKDAEGTCFGGSSVCIFRLPAGSVRAIITGTTRNGARKQIDVTSDRPSGGIINYRTREVLVSGQFQSGDTDIHLNLRGHFDNLAPRVLLPDAASPADDCHAEQPCSISAAAVDADGDFAALRYYWTVDGRAVPHRGSALSQRLSPGIHSFRVVAIDPLGGVSEAQTTRVVRSRAVAKDGRACTAGLAGLAVLAVACVSLFGLWLRRSRRKR